MLLQLLVIVLSSDRGCFISLQIIDIKTTIVSVNIDQWDKVIQAIQGFLRTRTGWLNEELVRSFVLLVLQSMNRRF